MPHIFCRYACDESVITLLRTRGLGNSAHQLQRKLEEQHHMRWLRQVSLYLSDCKGFTNKDLVVAQSFAKPPSPMAVPKYQWLQMVYCLDVMSRLDEVKAAITSTFGRILKIDSTKKVSTYSNTILIYHWCMYYIKLCYTDPYHVVSI